MLAVLQPSKQHTLCSLQAVITVLTLTNGSICLSVCHALPCTPCRRPRTHCHWRPDAPHNQLGLNTQQTRLATTPRFAQLPTNKSLSSPLPRQSKALPPRAPFWGPNSCQAYQACRPLYTLHARHASGCLPPDLCTPAHLARAHRALLNFFPGCNVRCHKRGPIKPSTTKKPVDDQQKYTVCWGSWHGVWCFAC